MCDEMISRAESASAGPCPERISASFVTPVAVVRGTVRSAKPQLVHRRRAYAHALEQIQERIGVQLISRRNVIIALAAAGQRLHAFERRSEARCVQAWGKRIAIPRDSAHT
jgi:hypothetical protein